MSSSSNMNGKKGSSSGLSSIPASSRKMVQSLKEIVNCPEHEIYSALKESNMDPNEAVNRLLTQDPFHEVKSKREKKKENKDTSEFRPRGGNSSSNRSNRGGTDRYVGRAASTQLNYSDSGSTHTKPAFKKENGMHAYTSPSYSASGLAGNNTYWQPSASVKENKVPTIETGDDISLSSQPSGYQSAWVGVPGQVSMADIVKMGRPHNKASGITSNHTLQSSQDHTSKVLDNTQPGVNEKQHISVNDEWPLIEQPPVPSMSSVKEEHFESSVYADPSDLDYDRSNQNLKSQVGDIEVAEDDEFEKYNAEHVEAASPSGRTVQENKSGGTSHIDSDMYNYDNTSSYQSHGHDTLEHQQVEDCGVLSSSSMAANFQQLSLEKEEQKVPPEEDNRSVVIPNHLLVQSVDCSHLSFGSFGSTISTAATFSGSFKSTSLKNDVEEPSTAPDASNTDTPEPEYYGEELRTTSEQNLINRSVNDENYGSPSDAQPEVLKQETSETGERNQYAFPSSMTGYSFENNEQLNAYANSQTSSQMHNLAPFSHTFTNSLPSTLLTTTAQQPMREADLSYSPFPITQAMASNYSNTVTSMSGSTISLPEALNTSNLSQQGSQTLPSANVATGPMLPQHLAVHPYSQPTLPPGHFANMISYPFLPQSYTYMPSAFQRGFNGNSSYHQSLAAAVLPQYKNSVSVSSLPQSGAVPPGYGAYGSSTNISGNFPLNPPAAPTGTTIGYDDIINSQYKDVSHLLSLQQNENSAMWLHGAGSRTMSGVPTNTYYNIQGQSQQPAGFRQGQQPSQHFGALGYPNFYHSQTGMSMEHQQQQQQIARDGSLGGSQGQQLKQSQQLWQNNY